MQSARIKTFFSKANGCRSIAAWPGPHGRKISKTEGKRWADGDPNAREMPATHGGRRVHGVEMSKCTKKSSPPQSERGIDATRSWGRETPPRSAHDAQRLTSANWFVTPEPHSAGTAERRLVRCSQGAACREACRDSITIWTDHDGTMERFIRAQALRRRSRV